MTEMSIPLFANPEDEERIKSAILMLVRDGKSAVPDDMARMPKELLGFEIHEIGIATSLLLDDRLLVEVGETDKPIRAMVNRHGGIQFIYVALTKGGLSRLRDRRWRSFRKMKELFVEEFVTHFASTLAKFAAGAVFGYFLSKLTKSN